MTPDLRRTKAEHISHAELARLPPDNPPRSTQSAERKGPAIGNAMSQREAFALSRKDQSMFADNVPFPNRFDICLAR